MHLIVLYIYITHLSLITVVIIIAVISVVYLTDKGEHTTLYKINNNICIKASEFFAHYKLTHRMNVMRSCGG